MKVYVITSGEYSDYGIDAVFTDKALAEEYADRNPSRRIETYEANKEVPEPAEVRWYYVNINTKDTSRIGVGYEMCEKNAIQLCSGLLFIGINILWLWCQGR